MLRLCKRCPPQPQEVQILRNLLVNGSTKSFGTFRPKILKHLLRWKSEKSIFWGHRARKWGPTVKIGNHSVFQMFFRDFSAIYFLPTLRPWKAYSIWKWPIFAPWKFSCHVWVSKTNPKKWYNRLFSKKSETSNDFLSESVPIVKIGPVVNFLQRIKVRPYYCRFHYWQKKAYVSPLDL